MGLSELTAKYRIHLRKLLPPGRAWEAPDGSSLATLCEGLAVEPARVEDRILDLLDEMDPTLAVELLPEWESEWGLPDTCTGTLSTLADRRAALMARVLFVGCQRPGFFIGLASRLGYTITVEENIGGDHTIWRVRAPETTVRWFRAGQNSAGDEIRAWGNEILECAILQVAPAHLTVLFAYGS